MERSKLVYTHGGAERLNRESVEIVEVAQRITATSLAISFQTSNTNVRG
jgi:hypothetical protein